MNIKVQCSCQTMFSFDVEPVDGKLPIAITCPKCGVDATENANAVIQQTLSTDVAAPETTAVKPLGIRLKVAHQPAAVAEPSSGDSTEVITPTAEKCSRHPRNFAVEHCVVCQKAICPECMQTFGFLCSVNCRYRADQEGIKVPTYKLQRNLVERGENRKVLVIASVVVLILVALAGAWFWYISVGLKPRPFYSLKLPPNSDGVYAKFLGPNQILMLRKDQVSLHDIKRKRDVWTTPLEDSKPEPEAIGTRAEKFDDFSGYENSSSVKAPPFFHGDNMWVCLSQRAVCVDLNSGSLKYNVPFQGRFTAFTPGETTLLVVSEKVRAKKIVTQINLTSGEFKTAEIASALREAVAVSDELPEGVLPTAAMLMEYELEASKKNRVSIYKSSTEFFPAGKNMVEMQVKLVEPKLTMVQTMKAAGPSNLGSDTRASSSARSIQKELFNEMKRNSGGGYKQVDESRYAVTLRRSMEENAPDWKGEVTSLPVFFPQKTVDILFAGKTLYLFDKKNAKIAESKLQFPIADKFIAREETSASSPCVEADSILYVFDRGVLTAFELPSATVRWRLPSVGIHGIQFDDKGMLYVSTTTASPEDIQYSEQIKVNDAIEPIILKVDPKTGKTLWKSKQMGSGCFPTGKYLYITDAGRGGFAMIRAVEEAFSAPSREGGSFQIFRMDPSNGKKLWSFVKEGTPENIDFANNRILLHYADEIEIMKFISF